MSLHRFFMLLCLVAVIVIAFWASLEIQSATATLIYVIPFIASALLTFAYRKSSKWSVQLLVASLSAFVILGCFHGYFLYDMQQEGVGVNIGLGLIFLSMPFVLPTVMFITGLFAGTLYDIALAKNSSNE